MHVYMLSISGQSTTPAAGVKNFAARKDCMSLPTLRLAHARAHEFFQQE